jgi:hypothetical protein
MSKTRNTLTELVNNLITSADDDHAHEKGCDKYSTIVLKSAVEDLKEHVKFIDYSDESIILELARVALGDAAVYEYFANQLDLSDEYMSELRDKVENLTQGVEIEY